MFHRRLLLLWAGAVVAVVPVGAQLARLTLSRRDEASRSIEATLVRQNWTPTVRGRILDRKGRVLAQDRPAYAVMVPYDVLTGAWARTQGDRLARRSAGSAWGDLSPEERRARQEAARRTLEAHLERGWAELAETARVPRAELERRRGEIIDRVERMHAAVVERRRAEEASAAEARGRPVTPAEQEAMERRATQPIAEQKGEHALLARVGDDAGFAVKLLEGKPAGLFPGGPADAEASGLDPSEEAEVVPGMRVADAGDREYPMESVTVTIDRSSFPGPERSEDPLTIEARGVATHIVGWMRDGIRREDLDARAAWLASASARSRGATLADGTDRGSYFPGDRVGHAGVEGSRESDLRGLRGRRTRRLDTGAESLVPPDLGRDVRLTIDAMLQARIQAVMEPAAGLAVVKPWHRQDSAYMPEGTILHGAAAVIEIDTGEILAMVTTPSFTRGDLRDDPERVLNDAVGMPFLNRVISKSYTPGSIVKPLVLAHAQTHGNFRREQRIACTGHLLANQPDAYRCWIYKRFNATHSAQLGHDLSGPEGIEVSCNIFFFTLGRRLGPEGISAAFRSFGVGESWGLGIGPEFAGVLGAMSLTDPNAPPAAVTPGDAIQMGIGQGPVAWTPLHAADAYATLARGGVRVKPRLVSDGPAPSPTDLGLESGAVGDALEGLRLAVEGEHATGRVIPFEGGVDEAIFNTPGVRVVGKTGTADAPDTRIDPDGPDGPKPAMIARAGDHSWFVILVGPTGERPRYAVSVVMDYAGSGAKVSGPICNQIVRALVDEGYLPKVEPAS